MIFHHLETRLCVDSNIAISSRSSITVTLQYLSCKNGPIVFTNRDIMGYSQKKMLIQWSPPLCQHLCFICPLVYINFFQKSRVFSYVFIKIPNVNNLSVYNSYRPCGTSFTSLPKKQCLFCKPHTQFRTVQLASRKVTSFPFHRLELLPQLHLHTVTIHVCTPHTVNNSLTFL